MARPKSPFDVTIINDSPNNPAVPPVPEILNLSDGAPPEIVILQAAPKRDAVSNALWLGFDPTGAVQLLAWPAPVRNPVANPHLLLGPPELKAPQTP